MNMWVLFLLLPCPQAHPQDPAKGALTQGFAERIPIAGVSQEQERIRGAVSLGAAYLLRQIEGDPFLALFVKPQRQGRVLDAEEVEVRYSRKTRTVPVFEYETYTVVVKDRYGENVAQTRRRPVRQSGTREEEYLVRDPNGDVVRKERRIRSKSKDDFVGGPQFSRGTLGQNGLALYALFRAGVPAETGRLSEGVADLVEHLHRFGLPDSTWDLAWLAAGLSAVPEPGEKLIEIRRRIANKLLLGQIPDEPGKGLWGPFSVNPWMIAPMMRVEQDLNKRFQDLQGELKANPEHKPTIRRMESLQKEREEFVKQYLFLDQTVHRERHDLRLAQPWLNFGSIPNDPEESISVMPLPLIAAGELLGDLASTRMALFGLWCLDQVGDLPERGSPPLDPSGRPLAPARQTAVILLDARTAVLSARNPQGELTSAKLYRTHDAFKNLDFPGVPVPREYQPTLSSEATLGSLLDGYAALTLLQGFRSSRVPPLPLGSLSMTIQRRFEELLPAGASRNLRTWLDSMDSLLSFAGISVPGEDTGPLLTAFLLGAQDNVSGYWGVDRRPLVSLTPGVLADFISRTDKRWQDRMAMMNPQALERLTAEQRASRTANQVENHGLQIDNRVFLTSAALLFLSDAVHQPAAASWPPGEEGRPGQQMLATGLDMMRRLHKAGSNLQRFTVEEDFSNLSPDLPLLLLTGLEPRTIPVPAAENLAAYVEARGLVLAAAPANPAGLAFLGGIRDLVQGGLTDSVRQNLPLGNTGVSLEAVLRPDGSLALLLLPIGGATADSTLPPHALPGPNAAMALLSEILQVRLGHERLQGLGGLDLNLLEEKLHMEAP